MKGITLLLALSFFAFNSFAQIRSEAEAMTMASKYAKGQSLKNVNPVAENNARSTVSVSNEITTPYYIYNIGEDDGFVIVSGDKRMKSILAHGDEGHFNTEDIHPVVKMLLESYAHQFDEVQQLSDEEYAARVMAKAESEDDVEPIEPLLKSDWIGDGLGSSFWSHNFDGQLYQISPGCATIAVCQLMKFWEFPTQPLGSVKYDSHYEFTANDILGYAGSYDVNIDEDLTQYTIDYSLVPLSTSKSSSTQRKAIGTLQYVVAVSFQTTFGFSSYTFDENVVEGLHDHLCFPNATLHTKKTASISDNIKWENRVISELQAGHPVIYSGSVDESNGHTWVVDGVDKDRNFHFNLGMGKKYNNYYSLEGGAGYPLYQSMITDIYPDPALAISDVKSDEESATNTYFDLTGRIVNNPSKGLYIYNGKKVLIK